MYYARVEVCGKLVRRKLKTDVYPIRFLRPDGDIYYLRFAPDPKAKPIVLLHVPVL